MQQVITSLKGNENKFQGRTEIASERMKILIKTLSETSTDTKYKHTHTLK